MGYKIRDIVNINNPRTEYPNKESKDFDSLDQYLTDAIKIIKTYADKYQGSLARRILEDEDAIANIAHKMMLGDWRWTPEYKSKSGRAHSRRAYRFQCAVWAIKEYVKRQEKKRKYGKHISIDKLKNEFNWEHPQVCSPLDNLIKEEYDDQEAIKLDSKIAASGLKPMEEACLRQYHETPSFKTVGEILGISGTYARSNYDSAVKKLLDNNV